jgi:hypothetical protein
MDEACLPVPSTKSMLHVEFFPAPVGVSVRPYLLCARRLALTAANRAETSGLTVR